MLKKTTYLILVAALIWGSCIPEAKLKYLRDPAEIKNIYPLYTIEPNRIKPNDELYIRASSFDDVAFNFFSTQTNTNYMSMGTDVSISLVSYSVNDSGYIYFPILGHVYINNLTIDEATNKLTLLLSEYFNQPTIIIKFVNKRITVIGEVNRPGSYIYTNERINIFEALSLAGDISFHGNRKNVFLIRTQNDSISKTKIDLVHDKILYSSSFYLKSNDIVYVQPRNSITWNAISIPISLTFSTITTALLILSYVK